MTAAATTIFSIIYDKQKHDANEMNEEEKNVAEKKEKKNPHQVRKST